MQLQACHWNVKYLKQPRHVPLLQPTLLELDISVSPANYRARRFTNAIGKIEKKGKDCVNPSTVPKYYIFYTWL